MHPWVWILLLSTLVIKLPIIALMLWIPFRNDEAFRAPDTPGPSEDDGGSKALPGGPLDPHPRKPLPRWPQRGPRRGPHGSPPCPAPQRVRISLCSRRRVSTCR